MSRIKRVILLLFFSLCGCNNHEDAKSEESSHSNPTDPYKLGFESNYISVNGLDFHYLKKGNGAPIIFLHGFPYFSGAWYKLLTPLSRCFQVIAPDNRGYGYSAKPKDVEEYRIDKLVEDVRALILRISPEEPLILVGHDWGGVLAWAIGQKYPHLVDKLIVINAPPYNAFLNALKESEEQKNASRYIEKLKSWTSDWYLFFKGPSIIWNRGFHDLYVKGYLDDKFKEAFFKAWETPGAAPGALNWYRANIPEYKDINESTYWPAKHKKVTTPSLLIWSEKDKAFVNDTFVKIPDYVENLTVKTINTESHSPFLDHSEIVLNFMNGFLSAKCQ